MRRLSISEFLFIVGRAAERDAGRESSYGVPEAFGRPQGVEQYACFGQCNRATVASECLVAQVEAAGVVFQHGRAVPITELHQTAIRAEHRPAVLR